MFSIRVCDDEIGPPPALYDHRPDNRGNISSTDLTLRAHNKFKTSNKAYHLARFSEGRPQFDKWQKIIKMGKDPDAQLPLRRNHHFDPSVIRDYLLTDGKLSYTGTLEQSVPSHFCAIWQNQGTDLELVLLAHLYQFKKKLTYETLSPAEAAERFAKLAKKEPKGAPESKEDRDDDDFDFDGSDGGGADEKSEKSEESEMDDDGDDDEKKTKSTKNKTGEDNSEGSGSSNENSEEEKDKVGDFDKEFSDDDEKMNSNDSCSDNNESSSEEEEEEPQSPKSTSSSRKSFSNQPITKNEIKNEPETFIKEENESSTNTSATTSSNAPAKRKRKKQDKEDQNNNNTSVTGTTDPATPPPAQTNKRIKIEQSSVPSASSSTTLPVSSSSSSSGITPQLKQQVHNAICSILKQHGPMSSKSLYNAVKQIVNVNKQELQIVFKEKCLELVQTATNSTDKLFELRPEYR